MGIFANMFSNATSGAMDRIQEVPNKLGEVLDIAQDPGGFLKQTFDNSLPGALMKSPADFDALMLEMEKNGESFAAPLPQSANIHRPVAGPTTGFVRDMPNFLNASQLILGGGQY